MASTYSTNLKIELMGTGDQSGTWGNTTNTNLGTALEQSIVGYGNPNFTSDADLTITLTDTNATQVARCFALNVTSSVPFTATRNLIVPTIQKQYLIRNNITGIAVTLTDAGDLVTSTAHGYTNGMTVRFYNIVSTTGLIEGYAYFVINATANTFQVSLTSGGSAVALTNNGTAYLAQSIVVKTAAGTGVTVPYGAYTLVYADGTNVVSQITQLPTLAVDTLSVLGVATLYNAVAVLPVIDNIKLGYATTATAAGTTTLTLASPNQQFFTGTTTQTIVLPVTSTLVLGLGYTITNRSTGVLTVQSSGLDTIINIPSQATVRFTCILTSGTTAASWSYLFEGSANIPYRTLESISASVASNALTVTLNPCTIDFRSSTLTSGAVLTRVVPSAISLTISSGSTLGTTNGVESKIAIVAIDNAGTVELAVINSLAYGPFDESLLISTTAEGGLGAADSGVTFYSASARASVAFKIIGYVTSTQATAGAWVSAPSNVSGNGDSWILFPNITLSTAQATTSGTSIDFTGIPSWVKRVTVLFSGVSLSSTANILVQLGAGSVQNTGYVGGTINQTPTVTNSTAGFIISTGNAAASMNGALQISTLGSNIWAATGAFGRADAAFSTTAGSVTLSGTIDRVRITTTSTDTFDAGTINIMYE